jgi:hypothetical protein
MPNNYLKILSKFNGENETSTKDHIVAFQYCTYNWVVEFEDVCMHIFVQSLEGDPRKWFRNFLVNTFPSWEVLQTTFMNQ